MTFRLALKAEGPNPLYWQTLDQLIGQANISVNPDAGYIPQSDVAKTLSGLSVARGFAAATWQFTALTNAQRQILRSFCPAPAMSAEVYIETLTNELTVCDVDEFIQCSAILHWRPGDEEQQAGHTMGLEILFSHLVEI
jgi:hypothetical protein